MEHLQTGSAQDDRREPRWVLAWYAVATLLAVFTYFYGLDSDHIPKNGDEYPYAHITRITAYSGHLLPLQTELDNMRNTKPPMLFWQGIVSTNWAKNWTLWHLRYPSVIYTLLTAAMLFLLGWKLSRKLETGFLALLVFLAFFSTYRYGRPFLTNPPEVFWLFVPFFVLLYWRPGAFASRLLLPVLLGLAVGVGLLYKSFALAVPVGLALAWWYLHQRQYKWVTFLTGDAWKVALLVGIALAVFGLWFLLDPKPSAIVRDFILRENLKKFDPQGPSYLSTLLWGGSSIWSLGLGYLLNSGLLAFIVAALGFVAFKRRAVMADEEKLLWIWVVTLFIVFSLPSQRDERYLLPAMPALAVLCALNWHRMSRKVFVATLVAAGCVMALLAYLSVRLEHGIVEAQVYPFTYWQTLLGTAILIILGLVRPKLTPRIVNVAVLLVFLSFAGFMRPLDKRFGVYSREAQEYVKGKDVWVPTNFTAKEEGHRFFLPGANLHAYPRDSNLSLAALSERYRLFTVTLPINSPDPTGKIIGQRLDVGGRHSSSQIKDMLRGKVFENLFVRELLIEAPGPAPSAGTTSIGDDR